MSIGMPRHSHQVFDHKGRKRTGMFSRLWNGADNGTEHGVQHEAQHGPENGTRNGVPNGLPHVGTPGRAPAERDGQRHGQPNEPQQSDRTGAWNGGSDLTTLERELGVEFHVANGVLMAFSPGQGPPPTVEDHAKALLAWLQDQEKFVGNEVPSRTLEELLYPHMVKQRGWEAYAWKTVANRLAFLPGVRKRQADLRKGIQRVGSCPLVYYIPSPDEEGTRVSG